MEGTASTPVEWFLQVCTLQYSEHNLPDSIQPCLEVISIDGRKEGIIDTTYNHLDYY